MRAEFWKVNVIRDACFIGTPRIVGPPAACGGLRSAMVLPAAIEKSLSVEDSGEAGGFAVACSV